MTRGRRARPAPSRRPTRSARPARSARPVPSRRQVSLGLLAALLVVAGVLVAGVATYQSWRPGHAGAGMPGGPTPAAAPAALASTSPSAGEAGSQPPGAALWLPTPSPVTAALSPLPGLPSTAPIPTKLGLAGQLAPALADPALAGDAISLVVADPLTGGVLLDNHGSDAVLPASTAKLAVAVAALQTLGPAARLSTTVVLDGARVVLVGGGDPTLAGPKAVGAASPGFPAPARLSDLATQTASALKARGVTTVGVGYDGSLFVGPSTAPGWKPLYVTEGDVAPVSALEVDEGRSDPAKAPRVGDPAALAAKEFAALLAADGVAVDGAPVAAVAAADDPLLASVRSPTVGALVQRMLGYSDNDLAEALARHIAIATGQPATFAGGAAAVRAVVAGLGIDPAGLSMVDASGLSRSDRVRAHTLVELLDMALAPGHEALATIRQALPVAGFSGTLATRYGSPPAAAAAGVVRAKTGTLDGVVALAGYLDDASGRVLTFALVANGVAPGATMRAEAALDRIAAGLAQCGCS